MDDSALQVLEEDLDGVTIENLSVAGESEEEREPGQIVEGEMGEDRESDSGLIEMKVCVCD